MSENIIKIPVESGDQFEICEIEEPKIDLSSSTKEVADNIVQAKTETELKKYLELFNLNMAKKNAVRIVKYNELLDKVNDEAIDRFDNHSDEITNKEVLDYMKVVQESINNAQKNLDSLNEKSMITVNQQTNTVNVNVIPNQESKEKIIDAVRGLLKLAQQNSNSTSEEDVIDISTEPEIIEDIPQTEIEQSENNSVLLTEDDEDIDIE